MSASHAGEPVRFGAPGTRQPQPSRAGASDEVDVTATVGGEPVTTTLKVGG